MDKMKKGIVTAVATVSVLGLTFSALNACAPKTGTAPVPAVTENQYRTVNLTETDYPDLTYAAESAVDAVVYVEVKVVSQQRQIVDPFLEYFFGGGGQPTQRESRGSGSGVIIRPDGYIVTNNHVVANASEVKVTLNNNSTYDATVVGTDSATDVALLKIEADGLPYIGFGDSDNLRLGEWVLAIGSPLGAQLRGTITAGIVSAKGRSMPSDDGQFRIESFIQTDAAVNPGNSGGALVNKKGELVGINTAIVSQTGAYSGYSFAVPVNIVKKIVGDLIDFGTVKRAKLGVSMGTVNDDIAKELKLSSVSGVYINEVMPGSAAEKAGMKKDDVVIAIDSVRIANASALQEKMATFRPGDSAKFLVIRDGREQELDVTFLADFEETGSVDADGSVAFYGARIKDASKETLSRFGLRQGVEIVSVGDGKMKDAGAQAGFIIRYVNDQPVSSAKDVVEIARKTKRAVFIEGVTASGRPAYFGFGKSE
ncbi:MAG: trypsin-like peptidase domain-containing protein [Bacteroidales bacterium]|nr:trypsin-like peptidase domain-containing protein [Bacteroidales bacterium]